MPTDLLAAAAELVDIPSVSHGEAALADVIEERLSARPWLEVTRVNNSVVARTDRARPLRVIVAGHTDTVPANGNAASRVEGDVLHGLGAADMKGSLAVFLELADRLEAPQVDVTWVFYECEEVAAAHNGLARLYAVRPDLLAGDVAILGEPTSARVEAGCQGALRVVLALGGARAHTARPWMGRNAVHRLADVLARVRDHPPRRPVLAGCEYREAMQVVKIEGGTGANVVPDRAAVTINHRFAPDRTPDEALDQVRAVIGHDILSDDAELTVIDQAGAAWPGLDHPLLARLAELVGEAPTAKLGWTDVAFFSAHGVPAVNYGAGDPLLAHTAQEYVTRADLERVYEVLSALLAG